MENTVEQGKSIQAKVREYYGQVLSSSDDLKTNACCCATDAPPKYVLDVMPLISDEVIETFYGCGSPIPPALAEAKVLDLGCGTGRDVYVLAKLVGEGGCVIGVDMTAEQLKIARKYQDTQARRFGFSHSNVAFKKGYIEDLAEMGISDASIDVVVSNCVINLSPFKEQVFSEIYRVLKPGGELYFSDVFADRRIPETLQGDPVLRGECLAGALYLEDFRHMMRQHGWKNFSFRTIDDIHIEDFALQTKLGFIGFTSRTIRAIKAEGLEETDEDYGQQAIYLGGIPENSRYFDYDADFRFIKGKGQAVSGNVARALKQSRYGKYFEITAEKAHRGRFIRAQAQEACDIKSSVKTIDLSLLDDACKRLEIMAFDERVAEPSLLQASKQASTMQVNICYGCNLMCQHCYLECGPTRKERMSRSSMEHCLEAFSFGNYQVLDITGGSPELHPDLGWFMREGSKLGQVIVRTNLTLLGEPEYAPFMETFAEIGAHVVGSLPFYKEEETDAQRGRGVFARAIHAVKRLNKLGYGGNDELLLDLVFNVAGPFLPPPQELLRETYERVLSEEQGIVFNDLLAFNNYALGRFGANLKEAGKFDEYLELLAENFNALAVAKMMCRDQVNVDVDGRLYDCECNHVLDIPIQLKGRDATIMDIVAAPLPPRHIHTSPVCYSCAAGFGSSCGGSLV